MTSRISLVLLLSLAVSFSYGFPRNVPTGRIVGGRNAVAGEVPYQVSLRTLGNSFYCGGAIVAQAWTLSAAHCVDGEAQNGILVVAGTLLLNSGGASHQSLRYTMHPLYDDHTLEYDVAVIQNQVPFVFTALISAINLGSAHVGGGVNAIISGWGGTGPAGPPWPNALQVLTTTTLTNADCRSRHTAVNAEYIFDQKICTFTQQGQGICQGDSGGGLVVGDSVIGVVSWNIPCARGWPDAYIRVSYMRDWILQVIGT